MTGDTGPDITALQRALNRTSLSPALTIDGIYGPATQSALQRFQMSAGIAATGVFDRPTYEALGFYYDAYGRELLEEQAAAMNAPTA